MKNFKIISLCALLGVGALQGSQANYYEEDKVIQKNMMNPNALNNNNSLGYSINLLKELEHFQYSYFR